MIRRLEDCKIRSYRSYRGIGGNGCYGGHRRVGRESTSIPL